MQFVENMELIKFSIIACLNQCMAEFGVARKNISYFYLIAGETDSSLSNLDDGK
jgi:hypothetical protein